MAKLSLIQFGNGEYGLQLLDEDGFFSRDEDGFFSLYDLDGEHRYLGATTWKRVSIVPEVILDPTTEAFWSARQQIVAEARREKIELPEYA